MKGTLKVNGKEFTIELDNEILKHLKEFKITGYERVEKNNDYYYVSFDGIIEDQYEDGGYTDDKCYSIANYYSDKTVAENNAKADTLIRKLRRFAVEHREHELDWDDCHKNKYLIYYNHEEEKLSISHNEIYQSFGLIYFDTQKTADAAIEEFKDELRWYFTEYKDSL